MLQSCSLESSSLQLGEVRGSGSILVAIGDFQEHISMRVDWFLSSEDVDIFDTKADAMISLGLFGSYCIR